MELHVTGGRKEVREGRDEKEERRNGRREKRGKEWQVIDVRRWR